jgi:sugar-specific transcriptional regulator TrmB
MDSFSKAVEECRKKESTRVLQNASIVHAKELFLNLIDEARAKKENVAIVSGELNREFYSQLAETTQKALSEGIQVSLLVTNPDVRLDQHPFAQTILRAGGEVYEATEKLAAPHFIVVGDKRFRVETDHDQTKAIACFNNSVVGHALRELFDTLVKSSHVSHLAKPPIPESTKAATS